MDFILGKYWPRVSKSEGNNHSTSLRIGLHWAPCPYFEQECCGLRTGMEQIYQKRWVQK